MEGISRDMFLVNPKSLVDIPLKVVELDFLKVTFSYLLVYQFFHDNFFLFLLWLNATSQQMEHIEL